MKTINKILGIGALTLALAGCGNGYNINGKKVIDRINTIDFYRKGLVKEDNGKFYIYNLPVTKYSVGNEVYNIENKTHEDSVVIYEANKMIGDVFSSLISQRKDNLRKKALAILNAEKIKKAQRLNLGLKSLK